MLVSELRTLPPQDSFTFQDPNNDFLNNLPYNFYQVANGLNRNGVAQDYMPEVSEQTHSAWARLMIPAFLVGLTIRSLGFLMVCHSFILSLFSVLVYYSLSNSYPNSFFSVLLSFTSLVVHSKQGPLSLWI